MTTEHVNITDPYLHEPKGAATATSGEVYVADGAASGAWEKPELLADGWRDMIMPFTASSVGSLADPTFLKVTDNGAGSQGVYGYSFSATVEEELFMNFHIDHDYKLGSAFYPHIHWMPNSTNTGTVRWGIEWTAVARTATPSVMGNTTITYIEEAAPGTALSHMVSEVADPGITITGADTDMIIMARIFRDATHANDTFTGEAIGLFLDAHYQVDRYATPNKAAPFRT